MFSRLSARQLTFVWAFIFALALLLFAAAVINAAPVVEGKFESLRYRILAQLPPPEHTDFVPTPLPTPTEPAQTATALAATETAVPPTDAPTALPSATQTRAATATAAVAVKPIQPSVRLTGVIHDYQRWNNCGPTTLEMALSYFGHIHPQVDIANVLKPDPDDKNVRPDEMAAYARSDKLNANVRVDGTLDRIKLFLSNGLPVIVETGYDPPQAHQGWMGHYRLITAYDDKEFVAQDSYEGPNRSVDFATLDGDWKDFNRTYIVLYTNAQAPLVRAILGSDVDDMEMYTAAVSRARQELAANPKDAFAAFNLGSSLLGLKQYDQAAAAFDQARLLNLPWRMLWYQFGPYEAYYQVGRYNEVIALADATLKVVNDLEESHYYKGLALEALGQKDTARVEFNSALHYNKNYADAQVALAALGPQQ